MDTAKLHALLVNEYQLTYVHLKPAPRGFVAETYHVQAGEREYFAKIMQVSRYSMNLAASLPLLLELRQLGIANLSVPIPTHDGRLTVEQGGEVLALFEWIEGIATQNYPLAEYVQLLEKIHQLTPQLRSRPHREKFVVQCAKDFLVVWERLWMENLAYPAEFIAYDLLMPIRAEIEADWRAFEILAAEMKAATDLNFVLTHGDGPANVIVNETGQLFLIDWDDAILAPAERDTWFHLLDPQTRDQFLAVYRTIKPDYAPDERAMRYYLLLRYFEDIEGFLAGIFAAQADEDLGMTHVAALKKDILGWLRPLVRGLDTPD